MWAHNPAGVRLHFLGEGAWSGFEMVRPCVWSGWGPCSLCGSGRWRSVWRGQCPQGACPTRCGKSRRSPRKSGCCTGLRGGLPFLPSDMITREIRENSSTVAVIPVMESSGIISFWHLRLCLLFTVLLFSLLLPPFLALNWHFPSLHNSIRSKPSDWPLPSPCIS